MKEHKFSPALFYLEVVKKTSTRELKFLKIECQHLEYIRMWRNQQIELLRQKKEISQEEQFDYFSLVAWPEMSVTLPTQMIYMLEVGGSTVGYGGIVNIDWDHLRAEVSFLLSPQIEAKKEIKHHIFTLFLNQISDIAFIDLGIRRLFTETYASRIDHIQTLEACNFVMEGRLRNHVRVRETFENSIIHGRIVSD